MEFYGLNVCFLLAMSSEIFLGTVIMLEFCDTCFESLNTQFYLGIIEGF
jgi:hypothetical protein